MRRTQSRDVVVMSGLSLPSPPMQTRAALRAVEPAGCMTGLSLVSYGVSLGIRMNDSALLDRVSPHLPPGWKPTASRVLDEVFSVKVGGASSQNDSRPSHRLYRGTEEVAETSDAGQLLEQLESWLRLTVAVRARRRVFVHAGVVGWRGRALVVPGRSCSGKTTLVAALVRAGATYYSDEYAVLDPRGRVYPFPKPLSIRQGAGRLPKKCPVESLGGTAGTRPLPVGLVIVTHHRPVARWRPRTLSPAQGLLALLANSPTALERSEDAVRTLKHVVAGAVTLRGPRGEADDLAAVLLQYLDGTRAALSAPDRAKLSRENENAFRSRTCSP